MKTQPASRTIELPAARNTPSFSEVIANREASQATPGKSAAEQKTARRDALSFSVTFAIVAVLTGAMLLYKVAVTMAGFTSFFFYGSLAGMLFFAVRAILISRQNDGIADEELQ